MSAPGSAFDKSVYSPLGPRQIVEQAVAHLDHVLPAQAPIQNFVHHNTLHGYQHLPFAQALAEAEQLTGIRAWLPEEEFRRLYRAGRIDDADLEAVFGQRPELQAEALLARAGERDIRRGEFQAARGHAVHSPATSSRGRAARRRWTWASSCGTSRRFAAPH